MRRTSVAVSAAVALLALAACSSGSPKAASSNGAAKAQRPNAVNVAEIVARADTASKTLKSAHISSTTELAGKTTKIEGDVAYHPTSMDLSLGVAGQKMREVLVGKTLYLKLPASAGLGSAKPWISVSISEMSKLTGLDLDSLLNNTSSDQTIQLLKESQDLTLVGTETVDGQSTQHLSGTVDIQKALDTLSSKPASAQKESLSNLVKQAGMKTAHVELWVNAQQVPVKVTETYTSKLGNGSTEMHITGINAPVRVKAPAAKLVRELPASALGG